MSPDRIVRLAIDSMNHGLIEAFVSKDFAALDQLYTEQARVLVSGLPPIVDRDDSRRGNDLSRVIPRTTFALRPRPGSRGENR